MIVFSYSENIIGHIDMKKIIFSLLMIGLLPTTSQALTCNDILIEITNLTNEVCIMNNFEKLSGYTWEVPAKSIMPGQSIQFKAGYGPKYRMNYSCGKKDVTIQTSQSYNWFCSDTVNGEIVNSDPNLNVTYNVEYPECGFFRSKTGFINWSISDNSNR